MKANSISNLKISLLLTILIVGNTVSAHAVAHKKHRIHHAASRAAVVQKTIINNYGLINNGVVQKTQQSSTAISTTQNNSLHQDNSVHQTLTQTQINGSPVVANLNQEFPFVEPVTGSSNSTKGLVGWWKAAGNSIRSLNNNYGPVHGGVDFVPGIFGQAFSFDGTGGINIPDIETLKLTKSFLSAHGSKLLRYLMIPKIGARFSFEEITVPASTHISWQLAQRETIVFRSMVLTATMRWYRLRFK